MGWEVEGRFRKEGHTCTCDRFRMLQNAAGCDRFRMLQKPTQYCKAIILQLKTEKSHYYPNNIKTIISNLVNSLT